MCVCVCVYVRQTRERETWQADFKIHKEIEIVKNKQDYCKGWGGRTCPDIRMYYKAIKIKMVIGAEIDK